MANPGSTLRRAYGRELALGLCVALAAVALLWVGLSRTAARSTVAEPAAEPAARVELADGGADTDGPAVRVPVEGVEAGADMDGEPRFLVQVVDERDAPLADIPLVVIGRRAGGADPTWHGLSRGAELSSGADGLVAVELARLAAAERRVPGAGELEVEVRPLPGLERGPRLRLPRAVKAGARFRLVMDDASARLYRPLRVRVVDPRGTPCEGVTVQWHARSVERSGVVNGGMAVTDSDGRAELSLLVLREIRWNEERSGGTHRFEARIALALPVPVVADLGGDPTVHDEIVLELPDTGALLVRVLRADGTPMSDGATVRAWGWPRGASADDELAGSAPLEDGAADLERIGLGLDLRVMASPDDHSAAAGWVELAGPTRPGERVEALVRLGAERARIVFRAVDELGAPLAGAKLSGEIEAEHAGRARAGPSFSNLEADADGRVLVRLGALDAELVPVALRVEAAFERPDGAYGRLQARRPLTTIAPERENDLGALVFEGPPPSHPGELLASGVLVDAGTGAPVQGTVRLVLGDEGRRWEWACSLDTGADGRFEIRGPPARGTVAVQAFAVGYPPAYADRGGDDLVLRLERERASVAIGLVLDETIPRSWIEIVLIAGPEGNELIGQRRESSQVLFEECWSGVHALEVRTTAGGWVVERLEEVAVVGRLGVLADPRADPLDLSGRFAIASFALVDERGAPLADLAVDARVEPWGRAPERLRTDREGKLALLVPARCGDVELAPEGFRPLGFGWLPGEHVLTFSRP